MLTVTGPVVPPGGATTTRELAEAVVTLAAVPLNLTVLSEAVALKLTPVIVTVVPTLPVVGEIVVIPGGGGGGGGGGGLFLPQAAKRRINSAATDH